MFGTRVNKEFLKNSVAIPAMISVLAFAMPSHAGEYKALQGEKMLEESLIDFSKQYGLQVVANSQTIMGKKSFGYVANATVDEALHLMLHNTGLTYRIEGDQTVTILPDDVDRTGYRPIVFTSYAERENGLAAYDEGYAAGSGTGKVSKSSFDEIVVTANRREQNLQDVPLAISVAVPDDFKAKGFVSLTDILAFTPGFNSNNEGAPPGLGTLTARGVGQFSYAPVVGVYLDDVPVNSNLSGEFFIDASLQDVERIELLKGPQGTLYGSTSLGGAVKYITRKPSLEEFRGDASANLSTTRNGGFNQLYSARISAPIVEGKLGITVSGFYNDNGGLFDYIDATTGNIIEKNGDTYERYGYSADLLFMPVEQLEVRLNYTHQSTEWAGSGLSDIDANYDAVLGDFRTAGNPEDIQSIKTDLYSGTINYQFDWATLTSVSAYVKSPKVFIVDQNSAGVLAFINSLPGHPTGTSTGFPTETTTGYKKFVQEVRLTSEASDSLEWIFGLYYTDEEAPTRAYATSTPSDWVVFDANTVDSYEEYAAFANLKYYLTPDLDVTIGGRISRQTVGIDSTVTGHPALVGAGGTSDVEIKDTADTWSLALSYRPSEDLSLYARAASGFRPARTNLPGAPITSTDVTSDSLWSYEVGAKGHAADGIISYDLALWYIDWNKFQTLVPIFGASYIGNAESGVTAHGFEGAVTLKPFEGFSVLSTLAYTDSTLDEDEPVIFGLKGQNVPQLAKWTASMNVRYDFPVRSDVGAHIGGGFRYSSGHAGSFDDGNPLSPNFNFPAESYILADLNAGLDYGQYSLNFYVTNLFDELVYTSAIYAKIIGGARGVPARPRTIGTVLSVGF